MGLPIRGDAGRTYTVELDSNAFGDEETFFCPGRALLFVRTQKSDGYENKRRMMRKLSFRILPPRSN
jgi:hypothetical protein